MRSSPVGTSLAQAWHMLSREDALLALDARMGGLSTDEAQRRLKQYGANTIKLGGKAKLWPIILHQFTSPPIFVLLTRLGKTISETEDG
ncbi:MAG: cation-transporting P-type ATPase [Chloroflexota bacterium]